MAIIIADECGLLATSFFPDCGSERMVYAAPTINERTFPDIWKEVRIGSIYTGDICCYLIMRIRAFSF